MPALSPELTALLDGTPDGVEWIAQNPALLAEAEARLPALHHTATAKAGREGVKAVIGRRFALYPQPQRSDGEWAAWWSDYFDVLEDVALASLEAAMRAHVADPESEFMPKPGRLRELAFVTPCRSLQRYHRAKAAITLSQTPQPRLAPPLEDAAKVRDMLAEFQAKAIPGEAKKPTLPSIAGKPDEGGLTPEMRAVLARQRQDFTGNRP